MVSAIREAQREWWALEKEDNVYILFKSQRPNDREKVKYNLGMLHYYHNHGDVYVRSGCYPFQVVSICIEKITDPDRIH